MFQLFGVGRYSADFLEGILDIKPATNPETTIYTAGEMVVQNSWERLAMFGLT